jgi:hypothetical protein
MTNDDFFVGYRPTSPQQSRRLRRLSMFLLIALIGCGVMLARGQGDPGAGTWDLDHATSLEGVFYARPYPMLLVHRDGDSRLVPLVNPGKHGASESAPAAFDRQVVRATGSILQRDDRLLLELDQPIQQKQPPMHPSLKFSSAFSIELTGEVIDPKCHTGAMKPGEGKTHKACAALCLRGGIPPMFLSRDGRCFLITDEAGNPATGELLEHLIALVGEDVMARGEISNANGLGVLKLSATGLRRLQS